MSFFHLFDLFCYLLVCRLCIIVVDIFLVYSSYTEYEDGSASQSPSFSSLVHFFRRIRLRDMVLEYCRIGFLPALVSGYPLAMQKNKRKKWQNILRWYAADRVTPFSSC